MLEKITREKSSTWLTFKLSTRTLINKYIVRNKQEVILVKYIIIFEEGFRMKIELFLLKIALKKKFQTSQEKTRWRKVIITKISHENLVGYGEMVAASGPWFSGETWETSWILAKRYMSKILLKKKTYEDLIEHPENFNKHVSKIKENWMAKAGLEEPFWVMKAENSGVSLAQLLNGTRKKIPVGISIGLQTTTKMLLDEIARALEKGYKRIKIKIKKGADVKLLEKIRKEFPDVPLHVDGNGGYARNDLKHLSKLDKFNLMMVEQPFKRDDLMTQVRLTRILSTPTCIDESLVTINDAITLIKLKAANIYNIKTGRVGGIYNAKKLHDYLKFKKVPAWVGGMLETGIGRAINLAVASLDNFVYPADISESARYYLDEHEIIMKPFELNTDGTITVPNGKGLGVDVNEDRLEKLAIKHAVIK